MASGEDWLFRPVLAGLCNLRDLQDGTYTLCDVADMNDALDVKAENEQRFYDATRKADER